MQILQRQSKRVISELQSLIKQTKQLLRLASL